ncbi:MAG: SGNH/GDSL hydrolase family protein [Acidimicrobiia bacterium]|nr:SGNH/GDSL hydrolase family protein [Acidimicrobiia bacterium]
MTKAPRLSRVLLTVLFVACALEGGARLFFLATSRLVPDPRAKAAGYAGAEWPAEFFRELRAAPVRWHPYITWKQARFTGQHLNVNEEGDRATWQGDAIEADLPTVVMVGGSTVFGVGSRDDQTLPSAVARHLVNSSEPARVHNFGQVGYVTSQDLIHLQLHLRAGLRPDVVVFYGGAGDVVAAWQSGVAGVPQNEENRAVEFNAGQPASVGSAWRIATSGTRRLLGALTAIPREEDAAATRALATEVVASYAADLRAARALAVEYGFELVAVWQPVSPTPRFATMWPLYEETRAALRDGAVVPASVRWVDLAGVIAAESPMFIDAFHVTEEGNAALAAALAPVVASLLAGRRPQTP